MYKIQISAPVKSGEINLLLDSTGDDGQRNNFDWDNILSRSLAYVTARDCNDVLIGFCNLSWDGGRHAIFYDLNINPSHQHKNLPAELVLPLIKEAEMSGVKYLHADFMRSRFILQNHMVFRMFMRY